MLHESLSTSLPIRFLPRKVAVIFILFGFFHLATSVDTTFGNTTLEESPLHGDAPNSSVCRRALRKATTHEAKCIVSQEFRGCRFDSGFFSYLEFQYCNFNSPIAPTIIMVLWLLTLLGAFAVIADSFFSPSLIALARSMRMSQNLAGVTLLAFGNGAPDVFSAVTAITTGDPEAPDEGLGLGFLMGSGLLVNTVTAGMIMIIHPFRTARRPYIKDSIFYMAAVSWCAAILMRRMIYLSDSIGFICLYIVYVVATWLAGRVRLRKSNSKSYLRCSSLLRRIEKYICVCLCSRSPKADIEPSTDVTVERGAPMIASAGEDNEDKELELNLSCCPILNKWKLNRSLRLHTQGTSTSLDRDDGLKGDGLLNGCCISVDDANGKTDDVKIVGFRSRTEHDSSVIGDSRIPENPRIEVTAPDDETIQLSSSILGPNKNLLDPRKLSGQRHTSPAQSVLDNQSTPTQNLTPSSLSRRGSQSGTTNTSFRKKSIVGGIGLKSRTPSMNQRRGSRRMSGIEQLPFVVRWIIANKEVEEKGFSEGHSGMCSAGEEKSKNAATQPDISFRSRYRHSSDSTQPPDISSIHILDPNNSLLTGHHHIHTRSPTVSFMADHRCIPHSRASTAFNLNVSQLHQLHRISSVSLPDLDKYFDLSNNSSAHVPHAILKPAVQFNYQDHDIDNECEMFEKEPDALIQWASRGQWHHLAYSLFPVDIGEWGQLSIGMRLLQIIQAPLFILFRLSIPVVYEELEEPPTDYDVDVTEECMAPTSTSPSSSNSLEADETDEARTNNSVQFVSSPASVIPDFDHLHGWCRLLNCFQCLLTPMLWVMLITVGGMPLGLHQVGNSGMPIVVIVLLTSTGLAITIFVTSRWDRAPLPYHRPFFAVLGFLTSVVWIYAIAHELVNSLETLGIVWEISEAILGISVMAFASSISDIMSNSLLAHNGYPRIAFAACIGSPIFNLLIGAGVSYTIKLSRSGDHNAAMSFTLTHALLFTFLMTVLTCNLIVAIVCKFQMRKAYGICLIVGYCIFLLLAILIEANVIEGPSKWKLLTGTE